MSGTIGATGTLASTNDPAITTGNSILPPPRLTGNNAQDLTIMLRWVQALYNELVLAVNVQGSITDLTTRVTTLETSMTAAQADITTLQNAS